MSYVPARTQTQSLRLAWFIKLRAPMHHTRWMLYISVFGMQELEFLVMSVAPLEVIQVSQGPPEDCALAADYAGCMGSIHNF